MCSICNFLKVCRLKVNITLSFTGNANGFSLDHFYLFHLLYLSYSQFHNSLSSIIIFIIDVCFSILKRPRLMFHIHNFLSRDRFEQDMRIPTRGEVF